MNKVSAQEVLREMRERNVALAQEVLREMSESIDSINESKERLRLTLVKKGFNIPEGLKLKEWIPYIEMGCDHERTISD